MKLNKTILLLTSILSASFSAFLVSPVFAGPVFENSQVLGVVYQCNTKLPFVPVQSTCGSQTLDGSTGSTGGDLGKYSITFNNATCNEGSSVSVTANVNGTPYSNSGTMGTFLWFNRVANVDIQTGVNCETPSVPEFGLITGLISLAVSAGSFVLFKKRA